MIKSMTGFASLTRDEEVATVGVTVKSVNHRFLDMQLRLPQSLAGVESRLRALVQRSVGRGRIDRATRNSGTASRCRLNEELPMPAAALDVAWRGASRVR